MRLRHTLPSLTSDAIGKPTPHTKADFGWFRRRQIRVIASLAAFVGLFEIMAAYCQFDLLFALVSIPTALGWMFANFIPTSYSLQFLGPILDAACSTILDSVAATLIGILTGTGIGFVFNLYYTSFRYDCAGLVVIVTIVAVLIIEAISNRARRSMI